MPDNPPKNAAQEQDRFTAGVEVERARILFILFTLAKNEADPVAWDAFDRAAQAVAEAMAQDA
jgi:hypothetical protein